MFSEKGHDDLSKLGNDELLRQYKEKQELVRHSVKRRGEHETVKDRLLEHSRSSDPNFAVYRRSFKRDAKTQEAGEKQSQSEVEKLFAILGRLRAEIDRRGLQVPTMEEQEQKKTE